MIASLIEIARTVLGWCFAGWKKKNAPTVNQRSDQIAKDYDAKRKDLTRR